MPATGTRRGHLIYHWRHGWIPLDHFAALSKAKGNHDAAKRILSGRKAVGKADLRRSPHIAATYEPGGNIGLHDSKTGRSVKVNSGHAASLHSQGHTIVAVRERGISTRSDNGDAITHRNLDTIASKSSGDASKGSLSADIVKDLRGGSADKHLVTDSTGTHFSPERAALHEKIMERIVGGHKSQEHPAFVMLGGGPASGKTKAAEAAGRDFPDAVTINPDDIKAMLPEYRQLGPDKAAAFTHEESSYLAKQATAAAIAQRSHIVLDAVGDNSVKSVEGKVAAAQAAGYSTHARYVTVPTAIAQARAVSRGQRSGRVVPPTVIAQAHSGVSAVFPQVMGKFDTASLHDNTTDWKPVLTTSRGKAPTIHDPAAYRAFLRKAQS